MEPFVNSTSHNDVKNELGDELDENIALPLHLQRLENALSVDTFVRQVQSFVAPSNNTSNNESAGNLSKQHLRTIKTRLYNLSKVKKPKKWIKDILLDKSDSSDSDLEMPNCEKVDSYQLYEDSVHDMIKFQNLKRKFNSESHQIKQESSGNKSFKLNSSELLGTNFIMKTQLTARSAHEESSSTDANGSVSVSGKSKKAKAASSGKSTAAKKKSNAAMTSISSATSTVASTAVGLTFKENGSLDKASPVPIVAAKSSLLVKPNQPSPTFDSASKSIASVVEAFSKVESPIVQTTTDVKNFTSMASNSKQLNSSLSLDSVDSMRYKERLLDEIPYDMTLPDEILQTESSFNPSDAIVSRPRTEEIVYNTNLPDEIFDTEESNISVISQTLSSPSPSINLYNPSPSVKLNSAISRPVTAPSTPTGLTSTSKRKAKSLQPRRPVSKNKNIPLGPTGSASPDTTDALQRKKVWMDIVKDEIPKSHMQMVETKISNGLIRKSHAKLCVENHSAVIKRWINEPSPKLEASIREEMFKFWSKELNLNFL